MAAKVLIVDCHHDGFRRRSRALSRPTHCRVGQETFHGMHANTDGNATGASRSGGHVDCRSMVSSGLKAELRCSQCVLQIDALVKRARDILNKVVTLRNSLRPVNCLPPEVLASCATFVSDTDPRPIVSLTHVCRYWWRSISSNPRS